jgi:signal transduction histidine kinase/ActR/RegA family two-component response regulator
LDSPNSDPTPKRERVRFPRWTFVSAATITLLALGFLAANSLSSYRALRSLGQEQLAVERLCGEITYLDEVLTMSARMCAATGDLAWRARYEDHVTLLDSAIESARWLAPGAEENRATQQTDQANQALVAMEQQAFELVGAGRREQAAAILDSDDYARNKQVYMLGLQRYTHAMRARNRAVLEQERARAHVGLWVVAVSVPLLAMLWMLVGRSIRMHVRAQGAYQRELRGHAAAVERSNLEVQAAMRVKSDFLARMSHEIRTPMNGVLGVAELLSESPLDPQQSEYVETIRGSGTLLLSIIDDILDFSKIEAGMLRVSPVPSDPRRIVQDVVRSFQPRARKQGIALECQVSPAVPACVLVDPMRLRQILTNLVGNAVKFTERGSVRVSLDSRSGDAETCELRCAVSDTGVGIPADRLERIFESFAQADDSTSRQFGGTGLGLTISRELARLMQGRIEVASTLSQGSEFVVVLPLRVLAPQVEELRPPRDSAPARWHARVLVAEDNPVNQMVARRLIEKTGCRVDSVANGRECLAALARERYDLVFMDCGMPEMDGFEATRRIRAGEREGQHLPIIALTASAFPGDVEACRNAGMDDFVSKPFGTDNLAAVFDRWLGPPSLIPAAADVRNQVRSIG